MESTSRVITQRGGYNRKVDWYLTEASRLLGERSNFGGLVAVIERGGTGGCKGTKGCGITRIEPFENVTGEFFAPVHGDFRRLRGLEAMWRMLSLRSRWVLAARYCYRREKLPPGLHGQLGDLSAVAIVVCQFADEAAERAHQAPPQWLNRLLAGASKRNSLRWAEDLAATALEEAHAACVTYLAIVENRIAIGGAL